MTNVEINLSDTRTEILLGCSGCPKRQTLAFNTYPAAITTGIAVENTPIEVQSFRLLSIRENGQSRGSQQYQEGYTQISSYCIDKTVCPNEAEIGQLETAYLERNRQNKRA